MTEKWIHELKIMPVYFDPVRRGDKRFEIRQNDRDFHEGDILRLKEWDGEKYTGRVIDALVRYILYDWPAGLKDGYCIMSIDTMHTDPDGTEEAEAELEGGGSSWWYVCGECHGVIGDWDTYCKHCGRRIKRNE